MNMPSPFIPADRTQYLVFQLGQEEYGVPVLRVKEIIEYDVLTKLPGTPDAVRGVINLRGHVVPVLDLRLRFGAGETPITPNTCVVVVEFDVDADTALIGFLTDEVSRVLDLGAQDIEPTPAFGAGLRTEYLASIGKLPDKKFLMILDIDKVITMADAQAYTPPAARSAPEPSPPRPEAKTKTEPKAKPEGKPKKGDA